MNVDSLLIFGLLVGVGGGILTANFPEIALIFNPVNIWCRMLHSNQ